jgi:hypothetical protein
MITVIQIRKQTQSKTIEANQTGNRQEKAKVCTTKLKKDEGRGERVQWLVVGVEVSAGPR